MVTRARAKHPQQVPVNMGQDLPPAGATKMLSPHVWTGPAQKSLQPDIPPGMDFLGWRGRTPPEPRCHKPVTPQEPYQRLGNDSNLCLGCQVKVELCHSHHHLWTYTQVSHGGNGGHPEEWPSPQVPFSALGGSLTLRTPISECPSSTPVSPRLWGHRKPRLMDTTSGPGE